MYHCIIFKTLLHKNISFDRCREEITISIWCWNNCGQMMTWLSLEHAASRGIGSAPEWESAASFTTPFTAACWLPMLPMQEGPGLPRAPYCLDILDVRCRMLKGFKDLYMPSLQVVSTQVSSQWQWTPREFLRWYSQSSPSSHWPSPSYSGVPHKGADRKFWRCTNG